MILVVGASGTNGREVVKGLVAKGERVRAIVRNPERANEFLGGGVELVAGDFDDANSLQRSLTGIDRAFFLGPVHVRYVDWFERFLEAADRERSPHIVRFSGMGSAVDSTIEITRQHGEADQLLASSGLPYTILRPNSFHQNMLWSASTIREHGAFFLPIGRARQSLVDVRDVAAVAIEVLTNAGHEGQTYDITGPESLSYEDVAESLSRVLGRPVRSVHVAPEAARTSMIEAGMPDWNAHAVVELYGAFAEGRYAATTDTVFRVTGREPLTFEQFARDHVAAFQ